MDARGALGVSQDFTGMVVGMSAGHSMYGSPNGVPPPSSADRKCCAAPFLFAAIL